MILPPEAKPHFDHVYLADPAPEFHRIDYSSVELSSRFSAIARGDGVFQNEALQMILLDMNPGIDIDWLGGSL